MSYKQPSYAAQVWYMLRWKFNDMREKRRRMNIPDDPIIRNCERTGYPDGKTPQNPVCPVCGEECDTFYKSDGGAIVGCDCCVHSVDAWDETANN